MSFESVLIKIEISDDEVSESTKGSTTKIKVARSKKKTNAQKCKEYRERKKLGYVRVPKNSAQRYDECCESDLLREIKKPKTNAQKSKEYRERKTLRLLRAPKNIAQKYDECCEKDLLQEIKKPKTDAQRSKEYRERQKLKKQNEEQKNTDHLPRKSTRTPAEYMRDYRRKVKLKKQGIQLNALLTKDHSDSSSNSTPLLEVGSQLCMHTPISHQAERTDALTMHEQNDAMGTQVIKIQEKIICDTNSEMIQVEVKKEPDCEMSEIDLSENHVVKEEIVAGPEAFQKYVGSKDKNQHTVSMQEQKDAVGTQNIIKVKEEILICDKPEMIEVEVKKEPDCDVESETDLYENHVIKEEMVTGPEVFHKYIRSQDAAQSTDPIVEIQNIKIERNPQEDTPEKDTKQIITIKLEKDHDWTDQTKEIVKNQSENLKINKIMFHCNVCGKQYDKQFLLAQHLESHEKTKQYIYLTCEQCSYKTLTQDSLERHMKFLHDTNRRFVCNVCGYRYKEQHHLNTHTKTVHADKEKYQCDVCGYKTNERCKIERHIRVHSKQKLYSCKECDYKSRYKHNVTSHMKKHSGERQFSCSVCGFKCIQKGHLKRHIKIHTGEKLFACTVCGYKCIQKCNLTRHMKIHHTVQETL